MTGVDLAVQAISHFLAPSASPAHVEAALDIWRHYHGWALDDRDVSTVLASFDGTTWPASIVVWKDRP